MEVVRLASSIQLNSIVDGAGVRIVVWFQGCTHNCKGCHNPQTHHPNQGFDQSIEDIIAFIKEHDYHKGVTLTGGDPFQQEDALLALVKQLKRMNKNIWVYTGYTLEEILTYKKKKEVLNYIDVLVDGRYQQERRDTCLRFKGSRNQRIIDMKRTMSENRVVLSKYDDNFIEV